MIFNYYPTSREPWRLKALLDQAGHAVSASFVTVRPKSAKWTVEFFWALLNSPLANAYAYSHLSKRHNIEGTMRNLRIPDALPSQIKKITLLVRRYFTSAQSHDSPLFKKVSARSPQEILLRVEAAVLDIYGLSRETERELLDLFDGWDRRGVPFKSDAYFPAHFEQPTHLRELIEVTYDWLKTNRLRGRLIESEVQGLLSAEESGKLEHLQRLADLRTDLLDPFDMEELEQLHAEMATATNG